MVARQRTQTLRACHETSTVMDPSQASLELREQADGCLRDLQGLVGLAHEAHRIHRKTSTGTLLTKVDEKTSNSSQLLQTWMRDFGTGEMTNDSKLVTTTKGWFENLKHWIEEATEALDWRLFFRKRYLIGFIAIFRLAHIESFLSTGPDLF